MRPAPIAAAPAAPPAQIEGPGDPRLPSGSTAAPSIPCAAGVPLNDGDLPEGADATLLPRLFGLLLPLHPVSLGEAARRRLSGLIFVGGVSFVEQVASALSQVPALSRHVTAASLRQRQDRAHRWFLLRAALEHLTELASDSYLHEQGTAIDEAMGVLRAQRLVEEAAALDPSATEAARLRAGHDALHGAHLVLAQREDRKWRQRQRARRARGDQPARRGGRGAVTPVISPALDPSAPAAPSAPAPVRARLLARLVGAAPR